MGTFAASKIGSEQVLDACLPDPEPLVIDPLDPPPPGEGVQFVMAPWPLPASSESEICFATYYDVTQQTPAGFRIAEVPVPTRYFAEASSVNLLRSVVYGLSTLRTLGSHRQAQRR